MATTRDIDGEELPNNSVHNSTDQPAVEDGVDPNVEGNYEVEETVDPNVEENYSVEYFISSYGADYPVDGLVKRINTGSIYVPRFQRSYVWNIYRASRFIESLLLGLPVPSIFLYKESESNKLLVIDGQQRLRTLQYFYNGIFEPTECKFRLRGVHHRFGGSTYETLEPQDRLRLDDSIIHAIIVKQEHPTENPEYGAGPSSIYHIFERLNTGGMLLQPQEIRSCLYHGKFIELLEQLNGNEKWRKLFGKVSTRMRDRELILRFLALYFRESHYKPPMKEFLNDFVYKYRWLEDDRANEFKQVFVNTISIIADAMGERAFRMRTAINAALFDAVTVGVAKRLKKGPITNLQTLKHKYQELIQSKEFIETISAGTTHEASVSARLRMSTEAFADVP
jgi:hypothetical protein